MAICRALLRDPEILILDEATSALDTATELQLQESVRALMAGRTSIVIAHRLSTVLGADTVVVIEGGRVREQGPPAALVSSGGVLAQMRELQLLGVRDSVGEAAEG